MKVLEAAEHLDGRFLSGPPIHGAVCCGPAEGFGRDHELVLSDHEQQTATKGELVADEEIVSDETFRAELVASLNRDTNDIAGIKCHQELEPTAEVGRLVGLTTVPLLVVRKRRGVDCHGRLQGELEHVVPVAVQGASCT